MTKYKEIPNVWGQTLDTAFQTLKEQKEPSFINFNGKKLYSDKDDIDSAYKKVTGKTKREFDEAARIRNEEYEDRQRKHKEAIPQLTKEWIEKGNNILHKNYHELWAKLVPIRLNGMYNGMELSASLDIINKLNANCNLEQAKELIDSQGHSGMSYTLVCRMVRELCDRGKEFEKLVLADI